MGEKQEQAIVLNEELLNSLDETPRKIIQFLLLQIATLQAENKRLLERVSELEARLSKDSHNSSKPPSSDGYNKPNKTMSLRAKSGKKPGGQKGHQGVTLEFSKTPDEIIEHKVKDCACCGKSLEKESKKLELFEKRQEFDLPEIKIKVTEHRAQVVSCTSCGHENHATFPEGIKHSVQLGKNIRSFTIYFNDQQLIPFNRLKEIFRDLFRLSISAGTLCNIQKEAYQKLEHVEQSIKNALRESKVIHNDESGIRVNKVLHWLHSTSTPLLTHYGIHPKRGQVAMNELGILPFFCGTSMHDYWKPYFLYNCFHALCNAHLLRELTFVIEHEKMNWAKRMKSFLLEAKNESDLAKSAGQKRFNKPTLFKFQKHYDRIVKRGLLYYSPTVRTRGKRGRVSQSISKNLLDRFEKHPREILAFMYDFDIPFDNNQAERDIRMTKVKQKISGCFRSLEGAQFFCRIRAYISTAQKQGVNVFQAIQNIFIGSATLPQLKLAE